MSRETSSFLNLPLELRNEIYLHVLLQHQPEIPLRVKGSKVVLHGGGRKGSAFTQRPRAFLGAKNPFEDDGQALICPLALSQVSHQIRNEFSDFLRLAPVDIVTSIRNFDWSHLMGFIDSLPQWRREQFLVGQDGTAHSILFVQIGGPYNHDWRTNLMQWIDFVEGWAGPPNGEIKTVAKVTQDSSVRDFCGSSRGEIVCDVYTMYQCQKRGAGRLELDKIFYTLLSRYRAEVVLAGWRQQRQPVDWADLFCRSSFQEEIWPQLWIS